MLVVLPEKIAEVVRVGEIDACVMLFGRSAAFFLHSFSPMS